MAIPDLYGVRRRLFPVLAETGIEWRFTGGVIPREYAGVLVGVAPQEARTEIHGLEHVYPGNFAKLKYYDGDTGRVWERGSYAHRPDGYLGDWQTHVRLFPHADGTALVCHHEYNPIRHPRLHYGGDNDSWDARRGVANARDLVSRTGMTLDPDLPLDGIGRGDGSDA